MTNNVSFGVGAKGVAKTSSDLDNLRDKFAKLQSQGAKGIGIGIAAGATGAALNLLSQAASNAVGFVEDSVKAFNEEQASIQKLGSSLKANVPNWDGNTAAIEKTLHAQESLGFTDDEQRQSLALLVAATHDVTKAQQLQSAAMDLARFKGISLAEASTALTSIEAGRSRGLALLGINVKDYATTEERVAAVEKVAQGQAAAFAQTNEGKLLVSQVKVNDAMEKFGSHVAGPMADAAVTAAQAVEGLANALDVLQSGLSKDTDTAHDQTRSILDLTGALGVLFPALGALSDASKKQLDATTAATDAYNASADAVHNMRVSEQQDLTDAANAGEHFQRSIVGSLGKVDKAFVDTSGAIIRAANKVRTQLASDAQAMITGYFDPIAEHAQNDENHFQTLADIATLASAKTKTEIRQDSAAIVADLGTQASALETLGSQGKLTKGDVDRFASDAAASYKALGLNVPPEIQKIIDTLRTLAKMPDITKTFTLEQQGNFKPGPLPASLKALGYTGNTDLVKRKIFDVGGMVPGPAGSHIDATLEGGERVLTKAQQSAYGGATFHITINAGVGSGLTAGGARQLVTEFGPALYADMQRKGYLPRSNGLRG